MYNVVILLETIYSSLYALHSTEDIAILSTMEPPREGYDIRTDAGYCPGCCLSNTRNKLSRLDGHN